jgi:transcriptional regulator
MYVPKNFEETDKAVLHALIRSHPLGAWVTPGEGGLIANHIPFLLHADRGANGTLVGHVARANPVWKAFSRTLTSVVIFQGPEAYVTPSWYLSRKEHGKVVPTWNYAVVHAHGIPTAIEDREWLLRHVTELTASHESGEAAPWKVSDAPADFIQTMLAAIVGIEIPITTLQGKWKMNQNRPEPDRFAAVAGLRARGSAESAAVANLVERAALRAKT